MKPKWLSGVLCGLLVLGSGIVAPGALAQQRQRVMEEEGTAETDPSPTIDPNQTPAAFRDLLVRYMHDMETTMAQALDNPIIGNELQARLAGQTFQLPIDPAVYEALENLDDDGLLQLQNAFAQTTAMFDAPATLSSALAELNQMPPQQLAGTNVTGSAGFANNCGTNYQEFDNVLSKRAVIRALTRTQGALVLTAKIAEKIADALRGGLEDVPIIGSKLVIIFHVIWGVTDVSQAAIGIAASALDLQAVESELCIASCMPDSNDGGHPSLDSGIWRGKGCDNRDNNCDTQGLIDEPSEDRFSPEVFVDSSALLRCYPSQSAAVAAAERAVTAEDDCKLAGPPTVMPISQACSADFTAQATDAGSPANVSVPRSFSLKVDGDPPVIGVPSLNTCYPTLAAARNALAATAVADTCSAFSTSIGATEKECVANLELEAVDECGNRSSQTETVRVDRSSPEVRIESLKIPSINGLSCFSSETAAVDTVARATAYSDDCTAQGDLAFATSVSGNACNLTVTSSVTDECAGVTTNVSSDSLLVRVDTEPPTLSCSVAQPVLWPANDSLVDIGFQLNLGDNCDPMPNLDVTVTSDESTRYAYVTSNGNDPYPDAVVERTATGGIQRILLRAQRRMTNISSYDGRVYRISVVATDACGLSSRTECWVEVPSTSGSTAVNSGQNYDATAEN